MPRYPSLVQGMLYSAEGLELVVFGTSDWFAWLKEHTAFIYQESLIRFTARREQRPGGMYWYAYKRVQGKLLKRYLGRDEDLNLRGLHEVAQWFALRSHTSAEAAVPSDSLAAVSNPQAKQGAITLLETKFHIPALPGYYIARSRLRDALERGTKARLTLVCAPAGSGKTTLLAAWARTSSVPVAWLSLEEADDDPLRFLSYLKAAFTHLDSWPEEMDNANPLIAQGSSWEEVLTPFLNELASVLKKDTVLVLDDYHLMTVEPIHAALRFLIEHAPPYLHLLIGTRFDPPLPLARLRARGQLYELRTEELRFVSPEVQAFLQAMNLPLSPDLQAALEQHTQGWIVAIQLLALALRGQAQAATLLEAKPGTHPFFLEYISEELLARLPAEERRFLLHTSILERMTGSLCEAVIGHPGGQEQLMACYQANLLINSLDDKGTWYSYHPLFAEALRTHLHKQEPEIVSELYRRAGRWYEEHGDMEEACNYAFLARDVSRAAQLLEKLLFPLFAQGKFTRLRQWLDLLPRTEIEASPLLSLAILWRQAVGTHSAETVMNLLAPVEQRMQVQGQEATTSWLDLQSQLTLLRALAALSQVRTRHDLGHATIVLEEALRSLPTQETALNQFISLLLRMALSMLYRTDGNQVDAERILLDIGFPVERKIAYPLNLIAWWGLAELYEAQGELRKWSSRYEALFQALELYPDLPLLPLAVIQISKAALLYEWNRLPEAARPAQEAISLTERIDFRPLSTFSHWIQARIGLAQGHTEMALAFLEREATPTLQTSYPMLAARPARLALSCDQFEVALRWAETRQLHFDDLPDFRSNFFEYMTLVRVLIARGRRERNGTVLAQALTLLQSWQTIARERGFEGQFIEVQMLMSLALAAQSKTKRALNTLGSVLARAEAEGYIRLFADEGEPMLHLLAQVSAYTSASPAYLQSLQAAFVSMKNAQPLMSDARSPQSLIDQLTPRELEVLRLLASGYSNQQIADQLVISLNTAKRHVKHLLAKLTVTNRIQAVMRARELHLL